MTLEPWDVVLTGNPPDTVGMRFLNHGDVYTARIAGLGELTNRFFESGRANGGGHA
jgi:2-keto-4-pentenoate hydratase/2-oxohepta-3-ene-1,7-dioic acid hydratase in catechol pathway